MTAVSHWISVTRSSGTRQLFGDQLRLRGVDALAELALAGVRRDACRRRAIAIHESSCADRRATRACRMALRDAATSSAVAAR